MNWGDATLFECAVDNGDRADCPLPGLAFTVGEGEHIFRAQGWDAYGNAGPVAERRWVVDSTVPTGRITVAQGNAFARGTTVTLALAATDPTPGSGVRQMRFRNGGTAAWSLWQPFAPTASWTLASGDGAKTVVVQFKDAAGNLSAPASDAIALDTVKPSGTVTINNGAATSTTRTVTLKLTATDPAPASGLATVRFRNAGTTAWSAWQPFATTKPWTLTPGVGAKTVSVQFRDKAGNLSAATSDSITFQTGAAKQATTSRGAATEPSPHPQATARRADTTSATEAEAPPTAAGRSAKSAKSAKPAGSAKPTLRLGASGAASGQAVEVNGTGFAPGDVTLTWDGTTALTTTTVDADGTFRASVTVPERARGGTHRIKATDARGHRVGANLRVRKA